MNNNGHKSNLQGQVDVNLNRQAWRIQREVPFNVDEIELLLSKRPVESVADRESNYKRKEKLIEDLFVAATKVLTEVQFQFFTSYYVLGMSEIQIADSFKVTQPYVSIVLTASIKKIKKQLKLS